MPQVEPRSACVPLLVVLVPILLALAVAAGYARSRSHLEIGFSARSESPGRLQVFHDVSGRFSETKSDWISVDNHSWQVVSIPVAGADATWLRLDPPASGALTVCGLGVDRSQPRMQVAVDTSSAVLASARGNCLRVLADNGAGDPQLVLHLVDASAKRSASAGRWRKVFLALSVLTLLGLSWATYAVSRTRTGKWWAGIAALWADRFDRRAHWILASLMLLFGTLYLIVTPPGAVADEEAHLSKVVRISEGVPFDDSGTRPMPNVIENYGLFRDFPHQKARFTPQQVEQQIRQPLHCEPTNPALPRSANGYFPHQYLLSAIVFKATCATGGSFGTALYLSRLLNLLAGTLLVAWGVRHAAGGKWALFLVALLPMTLFQISSISADSLTLSLSLAWLGLISGIVGRRLDPVRAAPWLVGLALAIALLKPGCAWVLAALLFCKPAYEAAGVSFRTAVARCIALPWLIHIAWTLHVAGGASVRDGVDAVANQSALLHDPLAYVRLLIDTFSGENLMRLGRSLIGVLGWLDVILSPWAYLLATAALVATLWTDHATAIQPARGTRPLALLFAIGSLAVLSLPLYLYWTLPDAAVIQGVQGRYFTITVAFVLVWCSFRAPAWTRAMLVISIVATVPLLNVDAIYQLYENYFVTGRPG